MRDGLSWRQCFGLRISKDGYQGSSENSQKGRTIEDHGLLKALANILKLEAGHKQSCRAREACKRTEASDIRLAT
jgi:hypothetical protein